MNYTNPKRFYNKVEDILSAISLGVALVLLFMQVVLRFILKLSMPTLEEYSIYLFVWYTFLTSSDAMRVNTHIRVEAVVNLFGQKARSIIFLLTQIFNLAFAVVFTYSGVFIVLNRFNLATQSTTGFPMWLVWLAIPICMCLTAIRSIQYIYFTIKYELLDSPLPKYIHTDSVEIDGVVIPKENIFEDETQEYELSKKDEGGEM